MLANIILLKTVKKLGKAGSTVKVPHGYANFLLSSSRATNFTTQNQEEIQKKQVINIGNHHQNPVSTLLIFVL